MSQAKLEITHEPRDGYLYFTVAGIITEANLIALGRDLRAACEAAGLEGAVLDCAGMQGRLSVGEILGMTPKFVESVGPKIKVAYINPPAHWIPSDDRFSRNVAYMQGGALEVFASEDEAAAWLKGEA